VRVHTHVSYLSFIVVRALTFFFSHAGTTVAIYELGCALGALSCMFIGDKLGRRKTIFLAGCVVIVGVIIQTTPFSLAQLIVARVITGTFISGGLPISMFLTRLIKQKVLESVPSLQLYQCMSRRV
jgi:MFS family permease